MDRIDRDTDNYRRLAYITHASMVSKPAAPEKLWPMRVTAPAETITMTKEMRDQIIATHGLNPDNFK